MFQNIDKLYGRNNTILVAIPTNQGFGANNLFGISVYNRLIAQIEAFAIIHDAVANHIDSFNRNALIIIYVVLKNEQFSQVVVLGLVICKSQARINRFCTDIKFFQVDGSRHKRKNYAGSIHVKVMNGIILNSLIQVLQVINRSFPTDNSELGTVHSIPRSHTMRLSLNHFRKFL